ncbi:MAG TPA: MATE family efflux transporter [Anaerolineaceae bacterium]
MFKDKEFFKTLFRIALPMVVQYVISSSMNLLDVMMIGQLGEVSVAAVGLSNQVAFLSNLMLFGILSGTGIFIAQYWGKRDLVSIHKVQGIGLSMALAGSLIFSLAGIFFPRAVLGIFTNDPAVIALGSGYLRISAMTYLMTAVTFSYNTALRSTENVRVPMFNSGTMLTLKTLLNYMLIFGLFGMPKLGIMGAAYATLIARVLEMSVLLLIVYLKKYPVAASPKALFSYDWLFTRRVLKTSLPVVANEVFWSLGVSMYPIVYARISTEAIAAINICSSIENLAFTLFMAITDATAVMVGNRIGAGEEQKAASYGRRSLALGIGGSLLMSVALLLLRSTILSIYKITPETTQSAMYILTIMALTIWVRVSNMMLIVGILRSGGDTRFCLLMDAGGVWAVGVPMAFLGAFVFHLPVHWVYLMAMTEEFVKMGLGFWRMNSGKWLNNLTHAAIPTGE